MKKLIFLSYFILFILVNNISGQVTEQKITLGNNGFNLEGKDFFKQTNPQGIFLADSRAGTLKSKFNDSVSIVSVVGYSPIIYTNDNKIPEYYFNSIKNTVNNEFPVNILFVSNIQPNTNKLRGKVFFSFPNNSYFPLICQDKFNEIEELIAHKFNNKCSLNTGGEIYVLIADILEELITYLDSGCELSENDEEELYKFKGYDIFDLPSGIQVDKIVSLGISSKGNRTDCPQFHDITQTLIILPNGSEKTMQQYFLEGTDYLDFPAQFVFTSGFMTLSDLVLAESVFYNTSCPLAFNIHISNKVRGPLRKVFIKTKVHNVSYQETSLDELKAKFILNKYYISLPKWDYRFKNHKDDIINFLGNDLNYLGNQNQLYAGFIIGIADGILLDMQFIMSLCLHSATNPKFIGSEALVYDLWLRAIFKGYMNAQVEIELEQFMLRAPLEIEALYAFFNDPKQAITMFYESIKKILDKTWENLKFVNGSFDAGYSAGLSVYNTLALGTLILKGGKGFIAASKGFRNSLLNAADEAGRVLSKEQVIDAIKATKIGGLVRTLDEIAPNGIIPDNSAVNNQFHKWFDELLPEELALVRLDSKLKAKLDTRIRSPKGQHEWCMVCEIQKFKNWGIKMSEIHRFRTSTLEFAGTSPDGIPFTHNHPAAIASAFHVELRTLIQQSKTMSDFNIGLLPLLNRWQIDPALVPLLIQ